MYLSQALTKLKNMKSKMSRLDKTIDACVVHYEDSEPEYSYSTEIANRSKLLVEIRDIKTCIQLTNSLTPVVWLLEEISLAKLILVNADLRSEMAFVQKLLDLTTEESGGRFMSSGRSKDDIKKTYAKGYSKIELHEQLNTLEKLKESIDGLMSSVNASTELVTK